MKSYCATTPEGIGNLPIHDAPFVPEEVVFEQEARLVVVPFAQEPHDWQADLPSSMDPEVVRETRLYTEYRVEMFAARLTVQNAVSMGAGEGWGDAPSLSGLQYDTATQCLRVLSLSGSLHVEVEALHVEATISPEIALVLRRRVDKIIGAEFNTTWS